MPRPRSDLAPRILAAARTRILHEGVDGASLRQIAADAGTTIGMIYYYFPTKDDVFLAVVEDVYEKLLVDVERALDVDVSPEMRIARVYQRIGEMSEVEFDVIRIIIRESLVSTERLRHIADRMLRGHLPRLLGALTEGRAAGSLESNTPIAIQLGATVALGLMPQLVLRRIREAGLPVGQLVPEGTDVPARLVHILLRGIASAEPTAPKLPESKSRRRAQQE